jgi:hypothetical protein
MKILDYIKQNRLAFWISALYVTLGGVVACSLYPDDLLNGDWWFFGWIITLPVNIISTAYRATATTSYIPVIIIQCIMFIPTFILISKIIAKRRNKKNDFCGC